MKPSGNGRVVRFGDVVRHRTEVTKDPAAEGLTRLVALEHLDPGVPYLSRWSKITDDTSFSRRFRSGQVLFSKRRVYQRKAALAPFDGICSGDLLVFEADEQELVPELLPFVVQGTKFMRHAEQTSAGSLSPRTKWKDLATFTLHLPPLEEQGRIAALLKASADDVTAGEGALAAARVARGSFCSDWFEKQLEEGQTVSLGDILIRADYGLSVKATPAGEVPILGMRQMVNGRMVTEGAGFVSPPEKDVTAFRLHPGDILFNRTNSIEHVGRVALNELEEKVVFASYLIRLHADPEAALGRFLFEYLASSPGQRRIRRFITRGVSQANINASNLKSIEVPVPPLEVQGAFVKQVEKIGALIAALDARHLASKELMFSLADRQLGSAG